MKLLIHKTTQLEGTVLVPGSKSQSVRALLVATLARGTSTLHHLLQAQDTADAIRMCRDFGANIQPFKPACHGFCVTVESWGVPLQASGQHFMSGNSGITTLFSMPLFGLRQKFETRVMLECGEQMKNRPVLPLVRALRAAGLQIEGEKFPFAFLGKLEGGNIEIEGNNSQYLSALLLASPYAATPMQITVENLQERPYVEMTLQWLRRHHLQLEHQREADKDIFHIKPGKMYEPFEIVIPGDFSSASYFLVAATLLPGVVTIEGLDPDDPQGDKKLISILQHMGADITVRSNAIVVRGGRSLRGIAIDANDIPDLVPTLAVLGTQAEGKTEIRNVAHARIKETDRLRSMATELTRMGADIIEKPDGLIIHKSRLYRASLHGYSDHRTIMALAVAGLLADGVSEIDTAEGMEKTFPDFVDCMKKIGAQLDTITS